MLSSSVNFCAENVSAKQTLGFQNLAAKIGLVHKHNGALKSMTVAEALVYTSLLRSEPGTEIPLIKVRICYISTVKQCTLKLKMGGFTKSF